MIHPPTRSELDAIFAMKYGDPATGWGPTMRRRFGYYSPDDHYEALIRRLVEAPTRWLEVGGGRDVFPSNAPLAEELSRRCALLVGVDPAPTLAENRFVHEKVQVLLDDYETDHRFDLVTLRMVAEHVEHPDRLTAALARCTAPGARVVIYTVNRFSPVPLLTGLVPFRLRHPIKGLLWRTEEKDTFPTAFRMNTRWRLRRVMARGGFVEEYFDKLDDCRSLGRFRLGQLGELTLRRCLSFLGLRYPENCLLGVYRNDGPVDRGV